MPECDLCGVKMNFIQNICTNCLKEDPSDTIELFEDIKRAYETPNNWNEGTLESALERIIEKWKGRLPDATDLEEEQ